MTSAFSPSPSPLPTPLVAEEPRAGLSAPRPEPARGSLSESVGAPPPTDREPRTTSSSLVVRGDFSIRFTSDRDFGAYHDACAWLKARGFSVGRLQANGPTGILLGDFDIQKWRNLDVYERADLHGVMRPADGRRYREGPIVIEMRRDGPGPAMDAFRASDEDIAARQHVEGTEP